MTNETYNDRINILVKIPLENQIHASPSIKNNPLNVSKRQNDRIAYERTCNVIQLKKREKKNQSIPAGKNNLMISIIMNSITGKEINH